MRKSLYVVFNGGLIMLMGAVWSSGITSDALLSVKIAVFAALIGNVVMGIGLGIDPVFREKFHLNEQ